MTRRRTICVGNSEKKKAGQFSSKNQPFPFIRALRAPESFCAILLKQTSNRVAFPLQRQLFIVSWSGVVYNSRIADEKGMRALC